jgi:phytoene/squalene synthetase
MVPTNAEADAAYCLDQVRRFDRDRYLTALFATPSARADLMALYAFNLEVAKTREMVREPMMGLMRLQWWRDCIADITPATNAAIRWCSRWPPRSAIALDRAPFDRLIDARGNMAERAGRSCRPWLPMSTQPGGLGLLAAFSRGRISAARAVSRRM